MKQLLVAEGNNDYPELSIGVTDEEIIVIVRKDSDYSSRKEMRFNRKNGEITVNNKPGSPSDRFLFINYLMAFKDSPSKFMFEEVKNGSI
ncbi:MAG: hypothetical protein ABIH39_09035 [Candidatus Margulisiibacteriota bacterium]